VTHAARELRHLLSSAAGSRRIRLKAACARQKRSEKNLQSTSANTRLSSRPSLLYRVAPKKTKPIPNDQKSYIISYQNLPIRLDLFVKLCYQANTKILFVGIKYSVHDLLFDVSNYAWSKVKTLEKSKQRQVKKATPKRRQKCQNGDKPKQHLQF